MAMMNTGGRLVAGSHNRNEFVLINADEIGRVSIWINPCFGLYLTFVDAHSLFSDSGMISSYLSVSHCGICLPCS